MCSLMQIRTFIQQYLLGDKLTKNLLDLAEIGITAWYLINYESG